MTTACPGGEVQPAYPPHVLRDYAFIADGRRGALIGPSGDITWLCAPRWDSPAVISHLIGGDGIYAITPTDPYVWGGYYEPGSLIWCSRWVTTDGIIECRQALAYPGDPHRTVVLRRVVAGDKPARVHVTLRLSAAFGRTPMDLPHRDDAGRWNGRSGELRVRWTGGADADYRHGALHLNLTVNAHQHHDFILEISDRPLDDCDQPEGWWSATEQAWRSAVPDFRRGVAPHDARHSYAVLRGLTSPDGGMVAAATLGLPERSDDGRNYDYRYIWIRDQTYAGLACAVSEPHPLLDEALAFVTARVLEHGDRLAPAYLPEGGSVPTETTLGLPGYPGDTVGNWVRHQFQLDTCGEILQLLAAGARTSHLNAEHERAID
ncbi:MAG: trehalase-like domain-containing protein, partial [Propionibacteriaceae bacterium]